jgi:hypothetical protein
MLDLVFDLYDTNAKGYLRLVEFRNVVTDIFMSTGKDVDPRSTTAMVEDLTVKMQTYVMVFISRKSSGRDSIAESVSGSIRELQVVQHPPAYVYDERMTDTLT